MGEGGLRVVVQEVVGTQAKVGGVVEGGEELGEGGDRQRTLGEKEVWVWELV